MAYLKYWFTMMDNLIDDPEMDNEDINEQLDIDFSSIII